MFNLAVSANKAETQDAAVQRHWYVACTMPNLEKQVALQLQHKQIERYLPLYRSVRRWNNGQRVELELPLFPGYVFVCLPAPEKRHVLSLPGVYRFISFNGMAAEVSESEIERLRNALDHFRIEPHPFLKIGQRVRIRYGPFLGKEGVLVRKKDSTRVVLTVDMLMQAIAVEIDAAYLDVLN